MASFAGRSFALPSLSRASTSTSSASARIPAIGLGTYKAGRGEVANAVDTALRAGYRHLDCAWRYGNEDEVAHGVAQSNVARGDIFITSKLWNDAHDPAEVEKACDNSLDALATNYLDLYLMHWPVATQSDGSVDKDLTSDEGLLATWRALCHLARKGKVRNVGVSNFSATKLARLAHAAKEEDLAVPSINQVELSLQCAQPRLVQWSARNGVLLQAYAPLGASGAGLRDDPVVAELARRKGVDPACILIAFHIERGVVALPKSVTSERIITNLRDPQLTRADLEMLERRARELGVRRTVDKSQDFGFPIYDESEPIPDI